MRKKITLFKDTIDIKKHPEETYSGIYLGSKDIKTKVGDNKVYNLELDNGDIIQIFGFTMLNKLMENVKEGDKVYITYKGMKKIQTKFGLKDAHHVEVEVEIEDNEDK